MDEEGGKRDGQQYISPVLHESLMSWPDEAGAAATKTAKEATKATASLENMIKECGFGGELFKLDESD
jgi:hypothetical protein